MKKRFSLMMAVVMMAVIIVLGFGMIGLTVAQDDEGPMSSLRFVVVRDSDGKPVRNAQVVLHPVGHKGKQAQGEIDLKTNADGKTSVDGIPYGPLRSGAGAAFPDLRRRLRDQQAGDGTYGEAETSGRPVLDL